MLPSNYRYDEFTGEDQSIFIQEEVLLVPAAAPYYVALREIPRQDSPSSIAVRTAGSLTSREADSDTYVYEGNVGTNYNASTYVAAGRDDAGVGHSYKFHALFQWDISSLPSNASKAIFWAYREAGYANPVFMVNQITSAWTASAVNWSTQPTYNQVPEASQNMSQLPGWYGWDITALYNAWKAGTKPNYGILLRTNDVDPGCVSNWTSTRGSGNHPHLDVTAGGSLLQEVQYNVVPAAGQFAVNYQTGRLRFPTGSAGLTYHADYYGMGSAIDATDFWTAVPANSRAPGRAGQRAADANYLYTCIADNTWRRSALSTF